MKKKLLKKLTALALSVLMAVGASPALLNAADASAVLRTPVFDASGLGVYDSIYFGAYEGAPIRWRVLAIDREANKVLVYQDNGFSVSIFNPKKQGGRNWLGSQLQLLTGVMAQRDFLADELGNILHTTLSDVNSVDQLFPLSYNEARRADYFGSVPALNLYVPGAYDIDTFWLRSPSPKEEERVYAFGYFRPLAEETFKYGDVDNAYLMRSAFWLDFTDVVMAYPIDGLENGNPWTSPALLGYQVANNGTNYLLAIQSASLANVSVDSGQSNVAIIGSGSPLSVPCDFTALSAWDDAYEHKVHYQVFDESGDCVGYNHTPYSAGDALSIDISNVYRSADSVAPESISEGTYTVKAWISQYDGSRSILASGVNEFTMNVMPDDPVIDTEISIDQGNEMTITAGGAGTLTATVTPEGTDYVWESDNTDVVAVDPATGAFSALAAGEATITVTTTDGLASASILIIVEASVPAPDPKITINAFALETLKKGGTLNLTVTVEPSDIGYIWSSSNPSIATVDPVTGKVTAQKAGVCVITVTTDDGLASHSISVRVTA